MAGGCSTKDKSNHPKITQTHRLQIQSNSSEIVSSFQFAATTMSKVNSIQFYYLIYSDQSEQMIFEFFYLFLDI